MIEEQVGHASLHAELSRFIHVCHPLVPPCLQGNVTMRVLKDMFESVLELGPMSQVGGQERQAGSHHLLTPCQSAPHQQGCLDVEPGSAGCQA
jgi:hypothetical protein